MTAEIELKNISLSYGDSPVLRAISLTIQSGEFIALLGASGCGKTTALKIIAGLLTADAGEVWLGGRNISNVAAEKRDTAMVFQKPLLFPFLNVAENVAFGLKMRKLPKAEIAERVAEALSLVQLAGFEHRLSKQLSGGQEQRVALARALVTNPRVLLLDEPFSALDAPLRVEMRNLLLKLQQRLKITAIFVTHDQEEAVSIADRIAFLDSGKLAQFSAPKDFFLTPQSASVARFFGWKILAGTLNGSLFETSAGVIEREKLCCPMMEGNSYAIAFHPGRAKLITDSTIQKDTIHLSVKLERMVNLGTKTMVLGSFTNGEQIEFEASGEFNYSESNVWRLSIPANALVVFPASVDTRASTLAEAHGAELTNENSL